MDLPYWLQVAKALATVATPVLIAVGGVFAWYKFFRQGEHDPRLQPSVSSEVNIKNGTAYIIATVGVQNAGQVDVTLNRELSGLLVLARKAGSGWRDTDTIYEVFPGQYKVQPNATLEEKIWIECVLTDEVAICLELAIAAEGGLDWRTSEIVSLLDGGHLSRDG